LTSAIEAANGAVVKHAMEHPETEGMASTIVAALIDGNAIHIAHVGDSRGYIFTREFIKRLTKDHSEVQRLVEAAQISPEQAAHYPGRNVITRAIGASTEIEVDILSTSISSGEVLLLCSDGLWEDVTEQEMFQIAMQTSDPQAACRRLVDLANERGGRDNISVVIVQCHGAGSTAQT